MNKFFIATIAMSFFLISAQATGAENTGAAKSKLKPVSISKAQSPIKHRKAVKLKKHVTSISFEKETPKALAKHQPKLKKDSKKNYKAIYCQDGYVVKNQAFCSIAKTKTAPNSLAKKIKGSRSVASNKASDSKKPAKVIKK